MNDWTRKHDIKELKELRKESSTSADKERFAKRIHEIANESKQVVKNRDKLARAVRANDRRAVNQARAEIQKTKLNESYGKANV